MGKEMMMIKLWGLEIKRTYGKYFSPSKKNPKLAMIKAVKHHDLYPMHTNTPQIS